jgi:hypothetical protein
MTGERRFTIALVIFAVAIGTGFWNESRVSREADAVALRTREIALSNCLNARETLLESALDWDDRAKSSERFVDVYRARHDTALQVLEQGREDSATLSAAADRRNATKLACLTQNAQEIPFSGTTAVPATSSP